MIVPFFRLAAAGVSVFVGGGVDKHISVVEATRKALVKKPITRLRCNRFFHHHRAAIIHQLQVHLASPYDPSLLSSTAPVGALDVCVEQIFKMKEELRSYVSD